HSEAKGFGSFEIDSQFVLGRGLHGQVHWLVALEDTIDVNSRTPMQVVRIDSVRYQAASLDVISISVRNGQSVPNRADSEPLSIRACDRRRNNDQSATRLPREMVDCRLDRIRVADFDRYNADIERRRIGFH